MDNIQTAHSFGSDTVIPPKHPHPLNPANIITLTRFAFMPLIVFFYFSTDFFTYGKLVALVLFVIAYLTDFLDGFVARKYNLVTDLGKLLDPIADKLLTFLGFALIFTDTTLLGTLFPVWFAFLIFFVSTLRDYVINMLRQMIALRGQALAANSFSKIKSSVQYMAITLAMLYAFFYAFTIAYGSWFYPPTAGQVVTSDGHFFRYGECFETFLRASVLGLLSLSAILSIVSGAIYTRAYVKLKRK